MKYQEGDKVRIRDNNRWLPSLAAWTGTVESIQGCLYYVRLPCGELERISGGTGAGSAVLPFLEDSLEPAGDGKEWMRETI